MSWRVRVLLLLLSSWLRLWQRIMRGPLRIQLLLPALQFWSRTMLSRTATSPAVAAAVAANAAIAAKAAGASPRAWLGPRRSS